MSMSPAHDGAIDESLSREESGATAASQDTYWSDLTEWTAASLRGSSALLVVLGVATCLIAWVIDQAIAALHLVQNSATGVAFAAGGGQFGSFLLLVLFRVSGVLLAVLVTANISPFAAGSGIPELRCIIAGIDLHAHMTLGTLVAKVVSIRMLYMALPSLGLFGELTQLDACSWAWCWSQASGCLSGRRVHLFTSLASLVCRC